MVCFVRFYEEIVHFGLESQILPDNQLLEVEGFEVRSDRSFQQDPVQWALALWGR